MSVVGTGGMTTEIMQGASVVGTGCMTTEIIQGASSVGTGGMTTDIMQGESVVDTGGMTTNRDHAWSERSWYRRHDNRYHARASVVGTGDMTT